MSKAASWSVQPLPSATPSLTPRLAWPCQVKRALVGLGAVDLLVSLLHTRLSCTSPSSASSTLSAVACLFDLLSGCVEAKQRLGLLVGYTNIPKLLPQVGRSVFKDMPKAMASRFLSRSC